ncbi:hypothetical protein MMPV_006798 [Pyropia vietnamensis]
MDAGGGHNGADTGGGAGGSGRGGGWPPLSVASAEGGYLPQLHSGSTSTSFGSGRPRGGGVEKPARPFSCSICDATFRQRAHQEKHISAVHLKEKPHWCSRCAARFGRRSDLNKHTRLVHLKQRPFSCPYPSCEQRFGQKCDWKKHMLTHQRGTRRAASAAIRIPPSGGFGTSGWGSGGSVGGVGGLFSGPSGGAETGGVGSGGGLASTHAGSGDDGVGHGGIGGGGGGASAAEELDGGGQPRQRGAADDGQTQEDQVEDNREQTLDKRPR